jgi:hypothetical protein
MLGCAANQQQHSPEMTGLPAWPTPSNLASSNSAFAASSVATRLSVRKFSRCWGSAAPITSADRTLRWRRAPPPHPEQSRGWARGQLPSATYILAHSAARLRLRPVPMRREAEGQAETALLRLVEALVQRLLGVG